MSDFKNYANSFQTVINLSLERIRLLLEYLENPHRGMKYIQVAGTNAKGSVCAFLQTALTKSGLITGKYISPNLVRVNERITVDGVEISDSELDFLLDETEAKAEAVFKTTGEHPTQFEIWTAIAFLYFKKQGCDIVILETGLGGRFDATNIIEENVMSIITRIAFDHMAYLGSTISEIAFEKCGIIKKNSVTVTVNQNPAAMDVIRERCREENSRLYVSDTPEAIGKNSIYEKFEYKGTGIFLGLGGVHQLENASLAVKALEILGIEKDSILYGLEKSENNARFQLLKSNPPVIFDGGHNPNGIKSLEKSLARYFGSRKAVFVAAFMKDKDIEGCLDIIKDRAEEIVFVSVENNERCADEAQLTEIADKIGIKSRFFEHAKAAVSYAEDKNMLTVICGSLYLYKDIEKFFL